VYYHPDGKVMVRGSYIKNLKHGKWVFFDQDGTMVKEQEYTM
jgi:antitoxin component YwqK of YwqJK toxin-antitoxin module